MRSKIFISIIFIAVFVLIAGYIFFFDKKAVKAERFFLKNGDLYSINSILGEKQLTTGGGIKLLFDQQQRSGKIIFGKEWDGETIDSERTGGTKLYIMNNDGSNELSVSDDLVIDAFFNNAGDRIFYSAKNADLYSISSDGINKVKLAGKVIRPNLSPDEHFLVYQKLNSDWQSGHYFDKALGIAILDLDERKERLITANWEDFNPLWSPDGKKILFFSRSPEGLASHFIINSDGSGRKQLTNIGEKFVSDKTVDIPSEKSIWSKNGKYLIYESDKEIWINEFDSSLENVVLAKQIAYGKNPQWLVEGRSMTIILNDSQENSLLSIDINGGILK